MRGFVGILSRVAVGAVFVSLCVVPCAEVSGDDALSPYYAGLRQRGLFRIAESDCLRRLEDEQLPPGARAELAIELSQTFAEHATYSSGHERDELWQQAADVVDQLQDSSAAGASPEYQELLTAQRGFVAALHGAQLRWQSELFPLDDRSRKSAAETLRSALTMLEPLPDALDGRMQSLRGRATGAKREREAPPLSRLREVRGRVEYRIAAALVDLVKVLPNGPDRAAAFHQAETALRALIKTPQPDAAAWQAEVLLIEIVRLRGELDRVGTLVTALAAKNPPPAIRDAVVAQWVRADLDAGHPEAAIERLQAHRQKHGAGSAELESLLVETLLSAREIALRKQQPELARDLLKEAELYATKSTGPWSVRSRLLVDAAREADEFGPVLAQSVRQAKWAWKNGDLEGAVAAYHRAVGEAHQSGRGEFAVELALNMATLQTEVRDFEGAVTTLTGLLDSYPDSPRAADAHLLRAYALGKRYAQRPDDERKHAYRAALEEHRTKYADSPTWAEATWMLARLEEHEKRWPEAIALLEAIPVDSKRGSDAQLHLAMVCEHAIDELRQRGEPADQQVRRAIAALEAAVRTFPPEPEPLTDAQAEVSWRLARLLLAQKPSDFARADTLLERVLRRDRPSAVESSPAKQQAGGMGSGRFTQAAQLRIISLAGQGRLDEARDVVANLDSAGPDHMLDVLTELSAAAEQVAAEHRPSVGQLQWELAQRLDEQRESLSAEQKLKLDECLARAHAALGRYPEAAALYQKLLWQHPDDQHLIEALARLYESCGSPNCLRNALTQWQALEQRQRKGTPEWLESRYHMAWCSHRIGDDEAARKLIGVTRLLYPELGSPELKRRFAELAAALSSRGSE